MSKIISILIAIAVIVGGVVVFNNVKKSSDDSKTSTNQASPVAKETVAQHKTANDCWTIISGKVYNITDYVPNHPGGNEILRACGVDGTSLFTQRTTSEGEKVGSGTPHSSSATSQLSRFLVGPLAN